MPRRRPVALLTGALVLALFAAGCGPTSFVGRRTGNFTAYYNTFYNAQKKYESGVKANEKTDAAIVRDQYLPLFAGSRQIANASDFEEAIKKSADVLRDHSASKWVDDALLLIGKARFYQQNFVGAEEKFEEVIALGSGLEDEARFWLGRTLIASGAYDEAEAHLGVSLARDGLSDRWASMLRLAFSELHVRREAWDEAAAALEDGLKYVRDGDLGARAQFLLAQVYETLGRYEEATEAYRRVLAYKPLYELSYAAQVSAVRVEGLHVDPRAALRTLRSMERDDKHYGYRAELAYLRGRILQAEGAHDDALRLYDELLYEPEADLNTSSVRGPIHYALGELFRDGYEDYVLAAAHFDTAATALRGSNGTAAGTAAPTGASAAGARRAASPPAAITDAREQAETFRQFADVVTRTAEMDSLLYVGSLDDDAFDAFVLELREARAAELAAQQRELDRRAAEQRFAGAAGSANGRPSGLDAASTQTDGDAGFLSYKDPMRVQEGLRNFQLRWGDRPRVPNWRRAEALDAAAFADADAATEAGVAGDAASAASTLPQIDVSAVPRDADAQAAMRTERAMARYELANVLFLNMDRPDSAAAWYRMVIDEDADQPVAQRAYYALAEVQRALGDTAAAHRIYEDILRRYPDTDFASRIRDRLGRAPVAAPRPAADELAERDYTAAYKVWKTGRHADAFDRMLRVAADHAGTPVAARALFAAGTIYTEWAVRDSLDLFAALPTALPDSLLAAAGVRTDAAALADDAALADAASPVPTDAAPARPAMVPEKTVPEKTVPEKTVPEKTVPEKTAPEKTAPEKTAPEKTAPEKNTEDVIAAVTDGTGAAENGAAENGAAETAVPAAPAEAAPPEEPAYGYTWVVGSLPARTAAEAMCTSHGADCRIYPMTDDKGTRYRVGLGFSPDRKTALQAREALAARLPDDAWLLRADRPAVHALVPPSAAQTPAGSEPLTAIDPAAPDSGAADALAADALASDSLASDSLAAPSAGAGAAGAVAPAAAHGAARSGVTVETLYASVADRYPESPFADRARAVLKALAERRAPLAVDSVAADSSAPSVNVAADSAAAGVPAERTLAAAGGSALEDGAAADSSTVPAGVDPVHADSALAALKARRDALKMPTDAADAEADAAAFRTTSAASDDTALAQKPARPAAGATPVVVLRSVGGRVDPAQGGLTLLFGMTGDAAEANALFTAVAQVALQAPGDAEPPPLALLHDTVEGAPRYRVVLGQFATAEDAEAARAALVARFPDRLPDGIAVPEAVPFE